MVHISTFFDRPPGLPGARQVVRSMLALSAVGTSEHGTLNLAKGIGTVANLDIGTGIFSFGSFGSVATRIARVGYGSVRGTVSSPLTRGRYGSWSGTVEAPRAVFQRGSFLRIAGSLGATRITHGTLGAARHQLLQNIPGSLSITTKTSGSLPFQNIQPVFEFLRYYDSPQGSFLVFAPAAVIPPGVGVTDRGLLYVTRVGNTQYVGLFGTLGFRNGTNSRMGTQRIGSFNMPENITNVEEHRAGRVWVKGQARVHLIGTIALRAGTNSRLGTTRIGSFTASDTRGLGVQRDGRLLLPVTGYWDLIGTLALRAGTNSRLGTTRVGSFARGGFDAPIQQSPNGLFLAVDQNSRLIEMGSVVDVVPFVGSVFRFTNIGSSVMSGSRTPQDLSFQPDGRRVVTARSFYVHFAGSVSRLYRLPRTRL